MRNNLWVNHLFRPQQNETATAARCDAVPFGLGRLSFLDRLGDIRFSQVLFANGSGRLLAVPGPGRRRCRAEFRRAFEELQSWDVAHLFSMLVPVLRQAMAVADPDDQLNPLPELRIKAEMAASTHKC